MTARFWILAAAMVWSGCGALFPGDAEDCATGICGCWDEERPRDFSLEVVSHTDGTPIEGIEVRCFETPEKVEAVSDGSGVVRFSVIASESPGCGFSRCQSVTFTDPAGRFASAQTSVRVRDATPLRRFPVPGDGSVLGAGAGPAQESVEWEQWDGTAPAFPRASPQPRECNTVTDCAQVRCSCPLPPRTYSAATCSSGACVYDLTTCSLARSLEPALCP